MIDYDSSVTRNLTLEERIELDQSCIHWYPYKRVFYHIKSDGAFVEDECVDRPSSIDDFPEGIWTRELLLSLS